MLRKSCAGPGPLIAALTLFLCGGCVSIRPEVHAEKSLALDQPETTALGRMLVSQIAANPGHSGFRLLEYGREALVARTALADAAERTIDAQYYICDPDAAGSLFFERLIAAADRGVKVRLLLDDNNLGDDLEMATLCAHPNIEVRVFNPFRFRARWARLPQYAFDFNRMVRRMHNKIFIADNAVSIIGGRNIGNNYFSLDETSNFRDFDLLMAGPITRDASAAFDEFWNSRWSVPATRLVRNTPGPAQLDGLREKITRRIETIENLQNENGERGRGYLRELAGPDAVVWARGEIVSEPPRKVQHSSRETARVSLHLGQELMRTERELLVEAAYVIPTRALEAQLEAMARKGVVVKLMTAGLEATDVSLVYSAYKRYRGNLLEAGVDLYEYKSRPGLTRSERRWYRPRSSVSSLHAKAIVFDRQRVWIGSANLDPRSVRLNTEIAVLVESPRLAAQMAGYLAEDFSPRRSWRVQLESVHEYSPHRGEWRDRKRLTWTGQQRGRPVTKYCEPATGLGQRTKAFLYSLIPGIEPQL